MRQIYTALKARIQEKALINGAPRFKYYNMWNNHVQRLRDKEPDLLDFGKPAQFFEFIPGECTYVGWGVMVYPNFLIKVHTVHEMFNNKEDGTELNLDVFDVAGESHKALQGYSVKGADYGTSALSRIDTELDHDHDNIYHWIYTYATTWTDNTTPQPEGGYEIDPPLDAVITVEKLEMPFPDVTASISSIAFGQVAVGDFDTQTFTIGATDTTRNLILSLSNPDFLLSLNDSLYKSRIEIPPFDDTIEEQTVYVKFTPSVIGAYAYDLNYGIPGNNQVITLTGEGI